MPPDPMKFEDLPLAVRLVWDPFRALDLIDDRTGRPDHAKAMPAVVMAVIIVLHFCHNPLGDMMSIILISAAYGSASWRTFLNTKAVTLRRQEIVEDSTSTTVVVAPRDTDSGIQPTSS